MLHYLHYKYIENDDTEEYNQIILEIKEKYNDKYYEGISFAQLKEDNFFDRVKLTLKWVPQRMNYVFSELDKIDINTFGKRKKFESMLDEL